MRDFIKVTTEENGQSCHWLRASKDGRRTVLRCSCGSVYPSASYRRMRVRRASRVILTCQKCMEMLKNWIATNNANPEGGMFDA